MNTELISKVQPSKNDDGIQLSPNNTHSPSIQLNKPEKTNTIIDYQHLENALKVVYLAITAILLFRFFKNIVGLILKIRQNERVAFEGMKIVLLPQKVIPFSFIDYVFVGKEDFENGKIEAEILHHEQRHIIENHTIDIVFIELLIVFFWFNPLLFLYRKAIALNHEFLADQSVIDTFQNTVQYQYLLLHKISETSQLQFSSQFNFLITKKRFAMMTKTTSNTRKWAYTITACLSLLIISFAFSDWAFAQEPLKKPLSDSNETGVSPALIKEYQEIVAKYVKTKRSKDGRAKSFFINQPSDIDYNRLESIFKLMSKTQQADQEFSIRPPFKPSPKTTPTEKEFESYKNPKIYGVWIDDKKVNNKVLNEYKASDFSQVSISKLYPNAQKTIGYKYKYQLGLETHEYYEKRLANKKGFLFVNNNKAFTKIIVPKNKS